MENLCKLWREGECQNQKSAALEPFWQISKMVLRRHFSAKVGVEAVKKICANYYSQSELVGFKNHSPNVFQSEVK